MSMKTDRLVNKNYFVNLLLLFSDNDINQGKIRGGIHCNTIQLVKAVKFSTVVCTQVNSKKKSSNSRLVHHP